MTDYDNYAGIYTCQTIGFTHRHSATILARKNTLDKLTLEKVRKIFSSRKPLPVHYTVSIKKVTAGPFKFRW